MFGKNLFFFFDIFFGVNNNKKQKYNILIRIYCIGPKNSKLYKIIQQIAYNTL